MVRTPITQQGLPGERQRACRQFIHCTGRQRGESISTARHRGPFGSCARFVLLLVVVLVVGQTRCSYWPWVEGIGLKLALRHLGCCGLCPPQSQARPGQLIDPGPTPRAIRFSASAGRTGRLVMPSGGAAARHLNCAIVDAGAIEIPRRHGTAPRNDAVRRGMRLAVTECFAAPDAGQPLFNACPGDSCAMRGPTLLEN